MRNQRSGVSITHGFRHETTHGRRVLFRLLIFHTAVGMTRALDEIAADGHGAAITPEALAGTSPYLTEHLNRFGSYELDLSKPPAPLPFELPEPLRPPSPATPPALAV